MSTANSGTLRPMLWLALPVLATNFLDVLVEFVDTWLVGNYLPGDAPLAAISLIRYCMWLILTLFAFVSIAATAMTARFVGAGNRRDASRVANQALLIGTLVSLLLVLLASLFAPRLVALLNLEGEAAELALIYLRTIIPVLPLVMVEVVGIACLRGAGDTISGLVAMIVVNILNVILSSGLLLGWGPFPKLGWQGLAIGTACGRTIGGLIILTLLARGRYGLKLRLRDMAPDRELIGRLLRIGIPGGVDAVAIVSCHMWYVSIINGLGTLAAAAHGVGISIEAMAYLPGAAFQVAAATLAGQSLGAGDPRRATHSALLALLVGGTFMSACGLVFYFGATPLARFFIGDDASPVVPVAAELLQIVAWSMPALAGSMILAGALRGAGDTRWPLLITFIGFLGLRIPLVYLLACNQFEIPLLGVTLHGFGLGVYGAWYGMLVDVLARCAMILARFLQGGWKRTVV